jgi:hypothetical protein
MLSVSVRQFRVICLVALASLVLLQLPTWGLLSLSKGVATLRRYQHYETVVPVWVLWTYAIVAFASLVIGLVGMLNFWRFSRWCLVAVLLAALLVRPFLGLTVYSAYEAFFTSVFGLSCVWLVTVSFWTPIAERFVSKSQVGLSPNNRWRGP